MVQNKPQLIIFDLDDTLVAAEVFYARALVKIGIAPDDPIYLQARQSVKERLPNLAPIARSRFLYLKTYLEFKNIYRPQTSFELAEAYEQEVVRLMVQQWRQLSRGVLFRKLRAEQFRIAVLTNESCRFQTKKLAAFENGNSYFDLLLCSEEHGFEKPSLSIFEEILSRFEVSPKDALVVGDSFENDIEPSLKLGIKCIQSSEFKTSSRTADLVVRDLNEILDHL